MTHKSIRKGVALLGVLLLAGCTTGNTQTIQEQTVPSVTETPDTEQTEVSAVPVPDMNDVIATVLEKEKTGEGERTATIELKDEGIKITGTGCEARNGCLVIKEAGVYEISGTLSNGSILVNADNKSEVQLILNGVIVHNETSAAIYCKKAASVTLTLAEGSTNKLSDGGSYVFEEGEDEPDATLFAKQDLIINGKGALQITSAYADAIKGKDALYILGGEIAVNSADDGIVGRDLLYICDGDFTVDAKADALKTTNDEDASLGNVVIDGGVFAIVAGTDGIQAETGVTVNGGSFSIKTGGGSVNSFKKAETPGFGGREWGNWGRPGAMTETTAEETPSAKGIKAGTVLSVTGGSFELDTLDDALHGNKEVVISGGDIFIMSGDDGVHADDTLRVEGNSKLQIVESYEGLEASKVVIEGGEIEIVATDDGINASEGTGGSAFGRPGLGMLGQGQAEIIINGGTITVTASADGDGIDANGTITINGGTIFAYGPEGGVNGVLDSDRTITLNGGTVLAVGGADMVQTPTDSSGQYSVAAILSSAAPAESSIEIMINGETIISAKAPNRFRYIMASSKEFDAESEVAVVVNGEECYSGKLTEVVTWFGENVGGMGGFGGFGGFGRPGDFGGFGGQGGFEWPEGFEGFGGFGGFGDTENEQKRPGDKRPAIPGTTVET